MLKIKEADLIKEITDRINVVMVNNGIGSYEYHGCTGIDVQLDPEIIGDDKFSIDITDFEYLIVKEQIEKPFLNNNDETINIEIKIINLELKENRLIATYKTEII